MLCSTWYKSWWDCSKNNYRTLLGAWIRYKSFNIKIFHCNTILGQFCSFFAPFQMEISFYGSLFTIILDDINYRALMHRRSPTSLSPSRYFRGNKETFHLQIHNKQNTLRESELELTALKNIVALNKRVWLYSNKQKFLT